MGPAARLAQPPLEEAQGAVVGRRFVDGQTDEFFDGQLKVRHLFGLAFGEAVQIGDDQHLEEDHGRVGRGSFFGQAVIGRQERSDKRLPINDLVQLHEEMIAGHDALVDHSTKERAETDGLEMPLTHGPPPREWMPLLYSLLGKTRVCVDLIHTLVGQGFAGCGFLLTT